MTWEIVWPDRVRNYGETSIDILYEVMQQQFCTYNSLDEFVEELVKRCVVWSGVEVDPSQHYDDLLKALALLNVITLYIDGECYNA